MVQSKRHWIKKESIFGSFMENNPIFLEFEKNGALHCIVYFMICALFAWNAWKQFFYIYTDA